MLATKTLSDKHELLAASEQAVRHLISQVKENGYISAAKDYWWYQPHWIRDSSWIAISLIRFARYSSGDSPMLARDALSAADKIIAFNMDVVRKHSANLQRAIDAPYEHPDFMKLSHRIPARVGTDGKFYYGGGINDIQESDRHHSWLMQHDNVPLIMLSIKERVSSFGMSSGIRSFIDSNMELMLKYVGKIYVSECSNAWEIKTDMLHAYDVAAAHAFFRAAEYLSEIGVARITKDEIKTIETGIYRHNDNGTERCASPAEFLKDLFVEDGKLYANKRPNASRPEKDLGFDAEELFIFTEFGLSKELGPEIEHNTISSIKSELFAGHELPVRFKDDTYYKGGRWLLLGLEMANYEIERGNIEQAERTIRYVIDKYGGSYPEQEIVDPAHPEADMDGLYAANGSKPIQDLAWSYAALVNSTVKLLSGYEREAIPQQPRISLQRR